MSNSNKPITLADVIDTVNARANLTPTKRRDLVSACNCVAQMLGHAPSDIVADVPQIREALADIDLRPNGTGTKRLSNIKADLSDALKIARIIPRTRQKQELTGPWSVLLEKCTLHHRAQLSRFIQFCLGCELEPEQVTTKTLQNFVTFLDQRILTKAPIKIADGVVRTWKALHMESDLSLVELELPKCGRRRVVLPITTYPDSFAKDIECYISRILAPNPFDEDAPRKAVRPITAVNIRRHILQFADELVSAGSAPTTFQTLEDLVTPATVKLGLERMYYRNGGRAFPVGAINVFNTLQAIAKYHVKLSDTDLKKLKVLQKSLPSPHTEMTEKNKARLAQFDNDKNKRQLYHLANAIFAQLDKDQPSSRDASLALRAVCLEILLHFPIRSENLATLDLKTHLTWRQTRAARQLTIRIPRDEVKNSQPLETDLNIATSRLIWEYIQTYRPLLTDVPSSALFPQRQGSPRPARQIANDIKALVKRETGLVVNAHLCRHLAGHIYLKERPGDYETVRKVLGHRKIETTTSFYTHLDNKSAIQIYDEVALKSLRGRKQ